jgi:(p)ppGpp synthase/HD superfamily hydrolase
MAVPRPLQSIISTGFFKNMNILETAKQFAIAAHESIHHRRKYDNQPYYIHCERVVKILQTVTDDEIILASAWMHDVLEDVAPLNPDFSEAKIREIFGDRICHIVVELTDCKLSEGNRATRKALDRSRLASASAAAQTIKLADLIDNLIDIKKHDPGFSIVIAKETRLLLSGLTAGNQVLYSRVFQLLEK